MKKIKERFNNKKSIYFCEECGTKLIETKEEAEKWGIKIAYFHPHPKYNLNTGKRNCMIVYTCPNRIKKWFWGMYKKDKKHSYFAEKFNF